MIFVTVGTSQYPFDRLIVALDNAVRDGRIEEEVFAQTGSATCDAKHLKCKEFLTFSEMIDAVDRARVVVAHAGVGSTLLSLSRGKIPVVFPRSPKYNEVVDTHQDEFASKMEAQGKLIVARNEDQLVNAITNHAELTAGRTKTQSTNNSLVSYLRSVIKVTP